MEILDSSVDVAPTAPAYTTLSLPRGSIFRSSRPKLVDETTQRYTLTGTSASGPRRDIGEAEDIDARIQQLVHSCVPDPCQNVERIRKTTHIVPAHLGVQTRLPDATSEPASHCGATDTTIIGGGGSTVAVARVAPRRPRHQDIANNFELPDYIEELLHEDACPWLAVQDLYADGAGTYDSVTLADLDLGLGEAASAAAVEFTAPDSLVAGEGTQHVTRVVAFDPSLGVVDTAPAIVGACSTAEASTSLASPTPAAAIVGEAALPATPASRPSSTIVPPLMPMVEVIPRHYPSDLLWDRPAVHVPAPQIGWGETAKVRWDAIGTRYLKRPSAIRSEFESRICSENAEVSPVDRFQGKKRGRSGCGGPKSHTTRTTSTPSRQAAIGSRAKVNTRAQTAHGTEAVQCMAAKLYPSKGSPACRMPTAKSGLTVSQNDRSFSMTPDKKNTTCFMAHTTLTNKVRTSPQFLLRGRFVRTSQTRKKCVACPSSGSLAAALAKTPMYRSAPAAAHDAASTPPPLSPPLDPALEGEDEAGWARRLWAFLDSTENVTMQSSVPAAGRVTPKAQRHEIDSVSFGKDASGGGFAGRDNTDSPDDPRFRVTPTAAQSRKPDNSDDRPQLLPIPGSLRPQSCLGFGHRRVVLKAKPVPSTPWQSPTKDTAHGFGRPRSARGLSQLTPAATLADGSPLHSSLLTWSAVDGDASGYLVPDGESTSCCSSQGER